MTEAIVDQRKLLVRQVLTQAGNALRPFRF